jgi:hypothetical protein
MKTALLALSLLSVTTFATRAEAQPWSLGGAHQVMAEVAGGLALTSVPVSLSVASLVLDGIIITGLGSGEQVKRSVLITNLVFSLIAGAMNAGLVAGSLALTRGEVTGWTGVAIGAFAFNAGSALLSGVLLKSKAPLTFAPMVVNGGAGASLSLRW